MVRQDRPAEALIAGLCRPHVKPRIPTAEVRADRRRQLHHALDPAEVGSLIDGQAGQTKLKAVPAQPARRLFLDRAGIAEPAEGLGDSGRRSAHPLPLDPLIDEVIEVRQIGREFAQTVLPNEKRQKRRRRIDVLYRDLTVNIAKRVQGIAGLGKRQHERRCLDRQEACVRHQ